VSQPCENRSNAKEERLFHPRLKENLAGLEPEQLAGLRIANQRQRTRLWVSGKPPSASPSSNQSIENLWAFWKTIFTNDLSPEFMFNSSCHVAPLLRTTCQVIGKCSCPVTP